MPPRVLLERAPYTNLEHKDEAGVNVQDVAAFYHRTDVLMLLDMLFATKIN
jgi:hypothetical protein